MFLSSYGAFGNNNIGTNGAQATTTIKKAVNLFFATANSVNATVMGYSNMSVRFANGTSNASISSILTQLSANGSISNYIGAGYEYKIYLQNMSMEEFKSALQKAGLNASLFGTAEIELPGTAQFYYQGQPIQASITSRNFSLAIPSMPPIGTKLPVHLTAMLTSNGTVYNGEMTCSYNGIQCG